MQSDLDLIAVSEAPVCCLQYKDLSALDAHKAGPEFQALASKVKEWFAEPLVLDLLEPSKL